MRLFTSNMDLKKELIKDKWIVEYNRIMKGIDGNENKIMRKVKE